MFGLLDRFAKRVNDQIVEYAAAQSEVARRLYSSCLNPFQTRQPVKVPVSHRSRGDIASRTRAVTSSFLNDR